MTEVETPILEKPSMEDILKQAYDGGVKTGLQMAIHEIERAVDNLEKIKEGIMDTLSPSEQDS